MSEKEKLERDDLLRRVCFFLLHMLDLICINHNI